MSEQIINSCATVVNEGPKVISIMLGGEKRRGEDKRGDYSQSER
jgi:hypothetical protein